MGGMAAAGVLPMKKLRVVNVLNSGESGKFCGNAESVGWMRDDGERMVVHAANSVRRAEWFEGQLRILCDAEDGESSEVVALDGFANEDFDNIWRYFEQACGVHVKKHRKVAALDAEDFDLAERGLEDAADRVDEAAAGSPLKKGRELDLLKLVEGLRDGLDVAVSGDKQALNRVFSANGCERIGRLRLVLDTVQLEVYRKDPRWLHLRNMCATIESVLKDLGTFRQWRPPEDKEHESMLRRMMLRELKKAQGRSPDEEEEQEQAPEDQPPPSGPPAPQPLDTSAFEGLAPFGAPHPVYGVPPPAPVPGPAAPPQQEGGGRGQPEEPEEGSDGGADEEVTDPNAVRASAPDDKSTLGSREARLHQSHPGSLLEGWVWKRSRFLRRWRRRWLVLMPERLMSFTSREGAVATETVAAGTVLRVFNADSEVLQARAFGVAMSKRTYFMVCDTEAQKQAWIRDIQKALVTR